MSWPHLDAPCIFCGYNGENYWQPHSHAASCPMYDIGGEFDRSARFPLLSARTYYARIAALEKVVKAADRLVLAARNFDDKGACHDPACPVCAEIAVYDAARASLGEVK